MKRFTKWCLILAGILLVLGIGLCTAGAVMGGGAESGSYFARRWNSASNYWLGGLSRLGEIAGIERELQQVSDEELTGVRSIEVDIDYGDISIRPQVDNKETFSVFLYWNLRSYELNYTVEEGVLKVSDESWGKHFRGGPNSECSVIIRVPQWVVMGKMDLSTNLGDVSVSADNFYVYEADLSTDLGDVNWSDTYCVRELDAGTDLGDVDVHLPGSQGDYRWELETDLGEVSVNGETQSGDAPGAELQGGTGECRINASSSLGNVNMSFTGRDINDLQYHGKYGDLHT